MIQILYRNHRNRFVVLGPSPHLHNNSVGSVDRWKPRDPVNFPKRGIAFGLLRLLGTGEPLETISSARFQT